jgi:hypothetical protein
MSSINNHIYYCNLTVIHDGHSTILINPVNLIDLGAYCLAVINVLERVRTCYFTVIWHIYGRTEKNIWNNRRRPFVTLEKKTKES